ncbi:MAG: PAS domain S-box protein [Deltaproteobacteria bacterium]|nr:PAS domain S-box protein [Deltaproteobacteria bacterium]
MLENQSDNLTGNERAQFAMKIKNEGIWDWNLLTNEVYFDNLYFTMAGYEPGDFPHLFEEFKKRVHPDDWESLFNITQNYLSGCLDTFSVKFQFLKKDSSWMWVHGRGKIVDWTEDGTPKRFIGTHTDISPQKRAEDEIKHLKNYLANIVDSMPSVLVGVDPEGKVTQWNMRASQISGISSNDAVGKKLLALYPDFEIEMNTVLETIKERKSCLNSSRLRNVDGEVQYEDVTVFPLIANGVKGAVIRIDDVTNRVRLEEMMVQSEKMLSVGGLAAGMAHEINNPLGGMMQTASVLRNRLTDFEHPENIKAALNCGLDLKSLKKYLKQRNIFEMLDRINETGIRAASIVSNMLSFARKSDSGFKVCCMEELLERCVELAGADYNLKKKHDFKKINILRDYEENLKLVSCESGKIQQVLLNILRNGAEAMQTDRCRDGKNDESQFILRLKSSRDNRSIVIEIEDNGPGMEQDVKKRVFEPFFTTKPTDMGTGLGLSVSYFIITENHNGTMIVESEPGIGSKFIITLPFK